MALEPFSRQPCSPVSWVCSNLMGTGCRMEAWDNETSSNRNIIQNLGNTILTAMVGSHCHTCILQLFPILSWDISWHYCFLACEMWICNWKRNQSKGESLPFTAQNNNNGRIGPPAGSSSSLGFGRRKCTHPKFLNLYMLIQWLVSNIHFVSPLNIIKINGTSTLFLHIKYKWGCLYPTNFQQA